MNDKPSSFVNRPNYPGVSTRRVRVTVDIVTMIEQLISGSPMPSASQPTPNQTVRISGIELSPAGLKPVSGNLSTQVKIEEVNEVIVRYGFRSAHPIIQMIAGGALTLLLIFTIQRVFDWLRHGGALLDLEVLALIPGAIGIYLLVDSLSRGYYLVVKTTRGKQRMCFDKKTSPESIKIVCQHLKDRRIPVVIDAMRGGF